MYLTKIKSVTAVVPYVKTDMFNILHHWKIGNF